MNIFYFYIESFYRKSQRDVALLRSKSHTVTMFPMKKSGDFNTQWNNITADDAAVIINTHANSTAFTQSRVYTYFSLDVHRIVEELQDSLMSTSIFSSCTHRDNVKMVIMLGCNAGRKIKGTSLARALKNVINATGVVIVADSNVSSSETDPAYFTKSGYFYIYSSQTTRESLFNRAANILSFFTEKKVRGLLAPVSQAITPPRTLLPPLAPVGTATTGTPSPVPTRSRTRPPVLAPLH